MAKIDYKQCAILILISLTLWTAYSAPEAYAQEIVVNPYVNQQTISQNTLRVIFGMRLYKWPDGKPIKVFVLGDDNPAHISFCKKVLNLFPYQLRRAWDRLVFSGTGQAPIEVASEEEMLKKVSTIPGAIGYIRREMTDDSVRILQIQ